MLYGFASRIDGQITNQLPAYNITDGRWSDLTVSGETFRSSAQDRMSWASTATSPENLGFVIGGENYVGGMIRFDSSDPKNLSWRNITHNTPPITQNAGMVFTRLGSKGSLIYFGGAFVTPDAGVSSVPRDMSQINVYDIDTATWHNITAGGDIPQDRALFCTVVSSAPDDSSFQITLYGGWNKIDQLSFADTYILSVPSFQWINVTDSSSPDANIADDAQYGRHYHECIVYKDRQMLVLGGKITENSSIVNTRICSPDYPALRALDLSTLKWKDEWDSEPEDYVVPDTVRSIIGGEPTGGATMRRPPGGFNDSALATAFAQVAPRYDPQDEAPNEPEDYDQKVPNPDPPVSTSDGPDALAIGCGVMGGVIGLAAVIVVAIFLWRFRKRRQEGHNHAPHGNRSELCDRPEPSELSCVSDKHPQSSEMSSENYKREIDSIPRHEIGENEQKTSPKIPNTLLSPVQSRVT